MSNRIKGVSSKNKHEYNGVNYRSDIEKKTAMALDALNIQFEYETRKITLLEGFRCPYQTKKVESVTYTPDFIIGNIYLECKGFETPEWKIKKKYFFKYLMENEPEMAFHQTHNATSDLLKALDPHFTSMGYMVMVMPAVIPEGKMIRPARFDSIAQAIASFQLKNVQWGLILGALTGKRASAYGYKWMLLKLAI